ncbi:MAG: hypothetical protein NT157_03960 [Candidatus Micrarchaeota archaeon]|nr:hypothetical protein [Candidatus Micrarchaeota archaeon]
MRPNLPFMILAFLASVAFAQAMTSQQTDALFYLRLLSAVIAVMAALVAWLWYLRSTSRPPILLWFGMGMLAEMLIREINLFAEPSPNTPVELLVACMQVLAGAFFVMGLWLFLCTRWIRASTDRVKHFMLSMAFSIMIILALGVMTYSPASSEIIAYTIEVMTSFWSILYLFISLMALYAFARTDEKMLAWFSAGFSMMVFASWYRLLLADTPTTGQLFVYSLLPLLTSLCFIIGVTVFHSEGKA